MQTQFYLDTIQTGNSDYRV